MNFKALVFNEHGRMLGSQRVNNETEAFKYVETFGKEAGRMMFYATCKPMFESELSHLIKSYIKDDDGSWFSPDDLMNNLKEEFYGCVK